MSEIGYIPQFTKDNKYVVRVIIEEKIQAKTEEEAIRLISNQVWNDKLGNLPGVIKVEAIILT